MQFVSYCTIYEQHSTSEDDHRIIGAVVTVIKVLETKI